MVALKRAGFVQREKDLTTKSIEGSSLPLQSIDNIHGCYSLSLCVLGVGDCITDHILKEHLQDTTSLFVD